MALKYTVGHDCHQYILGRTFAKREIINPSVLPPTEGRMFYQDAGASNQDEADHVLVRAKLRLRLTIRKVYKYGATEVSAENERLSIDCQRIKTPQSATLPTQSTCHRLH